MLVASSDTKKSSIKTKLTTTVFLTVSLLLISVTCILFFYFHSMLRDSIYKEQFVLATEIADQLNGRIELARHQLYLAATAIDSDVLADRIKLEKALTNVSPANMIFDAGFLVIGIDGVVITESMGFPELIGKDLNSRKYVTEPLHTGKFYISEPFRLTVPPNTPLIAMVVPVRDNNDKIICLLAGYHSLGADQFLTSLSTKWVGSGGYLFLIHGRTLLMHPEASRILEKIPVGKSPGIDRALEGFEGTVDNTNCDGRRMLSSFKKVGESGWILGANMPYDEAFKPLTKLAINSIAIAVIGILLSLLVVWQITKRLTEPLLKVIRHIDINTFTNNHWQPIEIKTGDEIEKLADTFNRLLEKLHLQNDSLSNVQLELQQKKAFVEGVLNKAAVPIFVLDIDHHIIVWNNALEDMTGIPAVKMIGTNLQWSPFYDTERPVLADLVLSADEASLKAMYENHRISQHVSGGQQAEGWLENVGGKRCYLLFDAAPVFDADGAILAVIETLLDITDRKLAEDEQRKLSWAVAENPCSIVITNKEGIIEYVNHKFCELTGYTTDEAIGQNPRILKSGEMPKDMYLEMWRDISLGKTWRGEFHNKKKNGELYWEIASISPVMDDKGEIIHYLAVKEDITARKFNEVELAASKEALQVQHKQLNQIFKQMEKAKREWETTLDCISDLVLMCDTYGKIKRCNNPVAQLTGLKFEEILDKNWMALLTKIGIQVADFDGYHGNMYDPKSGRSFEMNVSPIKYSDSPLQSGTVVSIHDTTILKTMNSKLQDAYHELQNTQSQVLQQEKMASIGQLAAGVAHEINNPMGFISSNLTSLGKYMDKINAYNAAILEAIQSNGNQDTVTLLNDLRKKMKIDFILGDISGLLAESLDGAGRVRRIVQDLKSFSRVDQAEQGFIDLNEALETTINIAWNEIKYVATLTREFGDIPPIKCYPQQLNQVFLNLLVNAAHAMSGGQGVITVKTWNDENNVFISVKDTGCGIAEENRQRVFEPFFTTKEVGKGTGLGLSISYDIIKKHGGEITLESEVGVGTTFIIRLPINSDEK